jgi:hypothetical protein
LIFYLNKIVKYLHLPMASTSLPLAFTTRINVGKGVYRYNPLYSPTFDVILPFNIQKQEQTFWCWASVAQALALFYNKLKISQCTIANKVVIITKGGYVDCCLNPADSLCNCPQKLISALETVSLSTLYKSIRYRALNRNEIKQELQNGNPIGSFVRWDKTTYGHFVVVFGFKQGKLQTYSRKKRMQIPTPNDLVAIADPADGTLSYVSYNLFTTQYRLDITPKVVGSWKETYLCS